ncbi:MAG: hypothetical protein JSV80_17980 [Acidobacteriota bacterium]|nr:MAG: hypothetical protein JSV80_17980 [Acidobacteriota bacterium]
MFAVPFSKTFRSDEPHRRASCRLVLRRAGLVGLVGTLLLAANGLASAAERIHFKNGHVIVVASSKVSGNNVIAVLKDGSKITFPKQLIAEVDKGRQIRFSNRKRYAGSGRGPSGTELMGYQRHVRQMRQRNSGRVIGKGSATSAAAGGDVTTVGYSRWGSPKGDRRGAGKDEEQSVSFSQLIRQKRASGGATSVGAGGTSAPTIDVKTADRDRKKTKAH